VGFDSGRDLLRTRGGALVLQRSAKREVSGRVPVSMELCVNMAATSIRKLTPLTVLLIGGAVVLGLYLLARSINMQQGTPPSSDVIDRVVDAIAHQEGFYIEGSRPARNHNPGDLTSDLTGAGVGKDAQGFVIYANDSDGFTALRAQVTNFFVGSQHYRPTMTILETAQTYVHDATAGIWAAYVANSLGVPVTTTWEELV